MHVGAKVARRRGIEREGRMYLSADAVAIDDGADVPECPPRYRRGMGDVAGGGLQEVELVDGRVVDGAGEDDEEHQQQGAAGEDEGEEGEDGSCDTVSEGEHEEDDDVRPAMVVRAGLLTTVSWMSGVKSDNNRPDALRSKL